MSRSVWLNSEPQYHMPHDKKKKKPVIIQSKLTLIQKDSGSYVRRIGLVLYIIVFLIRLHRVHILKRYRH